MEDLGSKQDDVISHSMMSVNPRKETRSFNVLIEDLQKPIKNQKKHKKFDDEYSAKSKPKTIRSSSSRKDKKEFFNRLYHENDSKYQKLEQVKREKEEKAFRENYLFQPQMINKTNSSIVHSETVTHSAQVDQRGNQADTESKVILSPAKVSKKEIMNISNRLYSYAEI